MRMKDCIFCTIVSGDKTNLLWENDVAVAFRDINPKAPVHVLVVAKQHIDRLNDLKDETLAGKLMMAATEVARAVGIEQAYRFHINNGRAAGQEVDHLHIHLLGNMPDRVMDIEKLHESGL